MQINKKVFTLRIRVTGALISNFVFENAEQESEWLKNEFPKLEKQHGKLKYEQLKLPGLKIGDSCCVLGEGSDVFVINDIKEFSPNRYGFILDSGWVEEVVKCYSVDKKW